MSKDVCLEGWKGIAEHLKVSVRTAQKWEKEQELPVRRTANTAKPRVFAKEAELDLWLARRPHGQGSTARIRMMVPILAALLIVAAVAVVPDLPPSAVCTAPASCQLESTELQIRDAQGYLCWARDFGGLPRESRPEDYCQIEDIDQDGESEILFDFIPADKSGPPGSLYCLDRWGGQKWHFEYGEERQYKGDAFDDFYRGSGFLWIQIEEESYVLTTAGHDRFPSQIALLDARTGEKIGQYWHPGRLAGRIPLLLDLEDDGRKEVLLGGNNNPLEGLGHAALVALKIPFEDRPLAGMPEYYPVQFTGGNDFGTILFPRPDVADVLGYPPHVTELRLDSRGRIVVGAFSGKVDIDGREYAQAKVTYYLNESLDCVGISFSDGLGQSYSYHHRQGWLDHSLSGQEKARLSRIGKFITAPDGNYEGIEALFDKPCPPIGEIPSAISPK